MSCEPKFFLCKCMCGKAQNNRNKGQTRAPTKTNNQQASKQYKEIKKIVAPSTRTGLGDGEWHRLHNKFAWIHSCAVSRTTKSTTRTTGKTLPQFSIL